MKKIASLLMVFNVVTAFCQQNREIAIIPEPVQVTKTSGYFTLPHPVAIEADEKNHLHYAVTFLQQRLSIPTGYNVSVKETAPAADIRLVLNNNKDEQLGSEGYRLSVTPKNIIIKANNAAGIFYGIQTLMQLLPKEIESAELVHDVDWKIPCVEITDYPRFAWRGLMLDVSRHFFTKQEVEQYIDQMARYKFNVFHFSLVNDEGWRIEIKSLPKLTQVGAWNVKRVGHFGDFKPIQPDEPRDYGGFYTQDDIREIVQYAKDRFVDVLPEIDMPGHSLAAIASYPELSCTPGAEKYKVASGEKFMEWPDTGHFYGLVDNTICPANEKVYPFIDKVMTEVAQLFPFEYIHIGGDECARNFWQKSDAVTQLMKRENLKNYDEVQSYFEKRVVKIVESKGKKAIGWDEILEGGLAPGAAVMSWRGEKGGIAAAKQGHDVVMSPTTFVYLDYMQSDRVMEPHVYASLRLSKTYQFDPVPAGVDAKYIKGGQGNLWTEQVYNFRQAQYMTWPRAFAIAECTWSPKEKKNWNDFIERVEQHFKRFDIEEVKYAPSMYDPDFKATKDAKGRLNISMSTEIPGLDIYYSFDNSYPDRFYPKYNGPLIPPIDATTLKVITYKGNKPVGRMISMPIDEMQRRADNKKANDED
ncbi:MAG TPA: family 20 glycosylhydrolase [Parafilimonas sp.]|nr:family 20 glycosylhydrolase [Parafilimonas sp.]